MKSTEAQKAWKRKDYSNKREYYIARDNERYYRFREILIEAKSKPCADCGKSYPTCVMDLDHRDGEQKVRNVSSLKDFSSEIKLREEIVKCDAVCANCHRIRTYNRNQYTSSSRLIEEPGRPRLPVTEKITGSNPVESASLAGA